MVCFIDVINKRLLWQWELPASIKDLVSILARSLGNL